MEVLEAFYDDRRMPIPEALEQAFSGVDVDDDGHSAELNRVEPIWTELNHESSNDIQSFYQTPGTCICYAFASNTISQYFSTCWNGFIGNDDGMRF